MIYDDVCSKRQGKIPKFGASQDFMTTIDYMYIPFKVGESHHLANLNVYIVGHLSKEQLSEFCQPSWYLHWHLVDQPTFLVVIKDEKSTGNIYQNYPQIIV